MRPCGEVPPHVYEACSREFAVEQKKAAAISKLKRVVSSMTTQDSAQKRVKAATPSSASRQATMDECSQAALFQETREMVARMFYAESIPFASVQHTWIVDAFDSVCRYGALTGRHTFSMPSIYSLRNKMLASKLVFIYTTIRTCLDHRSFKRHLEFQDTPSVSPASIIANEDKIDGNASDMDNSDYKDAMNSDDSGDDSN